MTAMLPSRRRLLLLAGSLVVATAMAACGRKGPLEPPPGTDKDKAKPPKGPVRSQDPIILDRLLN